jgi:serine/threonine protein kinase
MSPASDHPAEDPRVLQVAREYLGELESGRAPDRQAYLRRHPDLADALAECFDGIEMAHAGALALGPVPAQPVPGPGTLGDFQVVREIGRGGMGIVYEAVQLSLGRRVALKVLPFAAALDAKHLQRFKTEAHAAAALHHTNIVPVHAVGCERGVHFYAMQLIEGQSLDAVIRELRGEDAGPAASTVDFRAGATVATPTSARTSQRSGRARESYRTAARIAAQVADALEHAHAAGVIHRDIKPANLLLDARGTVWVTDFGLAQVSADVSLTRTGDMVGTLRYMSPEQAAGQRVLIDHRTDVYSLGATLYELLTLEPIFSGQDRRALLHQILTEEPRPPRQIERSIPVELETIVLKAVAKAPEERYATAAELAADLRRFLDERPILARRPTLVERARKWMRRHPSFVAAALLLLVGVVVALGVTTALVTRAEARTREAYEREQLRAEEAEKRFQLAQAAANDLIQVANEELADDPRLERVRKRLLEAALTYYQQLIEQRGEGPGARAELEVTRDRVKDVIADLAVLQQGRGQFDLLKNPGVLDDLRASAKQREGIDERMQEREAQRIRPHEFLRLTREQQRQRFVDEARADDKALRAMLTPGQLARLRQLSLQARGLAAFEEAEIVERLKLTAEQRDRIRGIGFGPPPGMPIFRGRPGPGPFGGPGKGGDDQERKKSVLNQALSVLTEAQRAQWRELTGMPFQGDLSHHPHCRPGGPPMIFTPNDRGRR